MLKTNYRISKNLKVVLAAFLLCAQFLLIVTDAFSIEQDHLFSNELCTENTLIELSDAYDLDTGSDCDHCCCLLYTSPSPRDHTRSRMPSSA